MKTFGKALYLLMIFLFSMNIGWVIYHWNTYETITFVTFEIPKFIYLFLQIIFLTSFASSLIKMINEDKGQKKI